MSQATQEQPSSVQPDKVFGKICRNVLLVVLFALMTVGAGAVVGSDMSAEGQSDSAAVYIGAVGVGGIAWNLLRLLQRSSTLRNRVIELEKRLAPQDSSTVD